MRQHDSAWSHPCGMTLLTDLSEARWVEQSLQAAPFAHVGALVPAGFARFVRLLHPARDAQGNPVRWAAVAAWSGHRLYPRASFEVISVPRPGYGSGSPPWTEPPRRGSLERADAVALAEVLAAFTTTPDRCFFAVWEGYGHLSGGLAALTSSGRGEPVPPPPEVRAAPRLEEVERRYLLYVGPLAQVTSFFTGIWSGAPNLWWPADRQWFVATDIDLDSTYIGGSDALVAALAGDRRFEVVPASRDDPTYAEASEPR